MRLIFRAGARLHGGRAPRRLRRSGAVAALAALTAALATLAALAVPASAGGPGFTVVMSGLDNPRGLALGPFGALYVAEAGRGGEGPCTIVMGTVRCYGATGAISRLWFGHQSRVVTGLPSYAVASGEAAIGAHDIALRGFGTAYVSIGLGGEPELRSEFGEAGARFAKLLRLRLFDGALNEVADIADYETAANPDNGLHDTNAFGLLAGNGRILTDAGGNSLLRVRPSGEVSTLATFPSRAQGRVTDAVPTSVARGPDGALYVSELTGVPFTDGAARIYRVVPGEEPEVFLEGFKTIIDIAFDRHGSLYVLQHATGPVFFAGAGALIRVDPVDGTRTTVASEGLVRPTSFVIARNGAIYVTNNGISAGNGQVVRLHADADDLGARPVADNDVADNDDVEGEGEEE